MTDLDASILTGAVAVIRVPPADAAHCDTRATSGAAVDAHMSHLDYQRVFEAIVLHDSAISKFREVWQHIEVLLGALAPCCKARCVHRRSKDFDEKHSIFGSLQDVQVSLKQMHSTFCICC